MKPAVTTQKWEAIKPLTKSINYYFFHNNFPAHGVAAWLSAPCIAALADLLVIKHFVDEAGDPIFPPLAPWSTCSPRIGGSVGEGTRGEAMGELLTQQVPLMYAAPVLIDSLICIQSACVIKGINL